MQHVTECQEVTVRFNRPSFQGQAIRYTHGPTGSQILRVVHDALRLSVKFINNVGQVIHEINFNSNDVLEYACENVKDKGPVSLPPCGPGGVGVITDVVELTEQDQSRARNYK